MAADPDFAELLLDSVTVQRKTAVILDGALSDSLAIIPVNTTEGLPATGTIILESEAVSYTALDAGNDTIGTAGTPATRGAGGTTAASHTDETAVEDRAGHPVEAYANNLTNQKSRKEQMSRQEAEAIFARAVVDPHLFYFPAGTDITNGDRIIHGTEYHTILRFAIADDEGAEHHREAITETDKI